MRRAILAGLALLVPLACGAQEREAHVGGTLRLTSSAGAGSMDVQANYLLKAVQMFVAVYDGLVAYKKVGGEDSATIVPDLADAIPAPSDGGRTYVFHLRGGIRFSDGREVGPEDAAASFRRMFKLRSPNAGSWYAGSGGAAACLEAPDGCTLAGGVEADETARTVTFRLTAPDPEFMAKLAMTFASIVPADSPARDVGADALPGTGPYMFASYDANQRAVLVRNPNFRQWSADAQPAGFPDQIVYAFGLGDNAEVTAVLNGQQDWMFETIPMDRLGEVSAHAPLVHVQPLLAYDYIALNTRIPPFDDARVRQAVNFAVDRRAAVNLFGGPKLAAPLCQTLPPGMPGFEPYCPWSADPGPRWTKPDLARARRLMAESGAVGAKVTLVTGDEAMEHSVGVYFQSVLNSLGFEASLRTVSANIEFTYIQNTNNNVQASVTNWQADYPAPSDFLDVLFACRSFHPGSDASVNISGWCDEALDALMQDASAKAVTDPAAANPIWAAADRRITDAAPVVTLFRRSRIDLLSPRVGGYAFSSVFNMLFSQAWVR